MRLVFIGCVRSSEIFLNKLIKNNADVAGMGKPPFSRSEENVRALATVRGAMAGVRYAEAYRLVKCI